MSKAKVLLLIFAAVLITLGFNTLDAMINTFYWCPWREWHGTLWQLTPWLSLDWWLCFFFFGVVPLCVGWFLLGWLAAHK